MSTVESLFDNDGLDWLDDLDMEIRWRYEGQLNGVESEFERQRVCNRIGENMQQWIEFYARVVSFSMRGL